MKIVAHRGLWEKNEQKNSLLSLIDAINEGFGFETDVRDHDGELYVSHDIDNIANTLKFSVLIDEISKIPNVKSVPLFINIKSDGIINKIISILNKYNISNYFLFDMSLPELWKARTNKDNIIVGISDVFKTEYNYFEYAGYWVDSFVSETWIDEKLLSDLLLEGYKFCIVSPELHGRDYKKFWEKILLYNCANNKDFMICTDKPIEARSFFKDVLNE